MSIFKLPNADYFQLVNDDQDVAIQLRETSTLREQLIIVDMRAEGRGFGWFISGQDSEAMYFDDWEMPIGGPRYFMKLSDVIKDAIEFINNLNVKTTGAYTVWQNNIPRVEEFLALNAKLRSRRRFCHECHNEIKPNDSWEQHSIGKSRILYCSSCAIKVNRETDEAYRMQDYRYP